ncbi:hypothetical protein HED22_16640 [Thalassospira sp. HF15]|uniref:hypothetical protein n=1 Tax=Thalassospira sp. HF15 TaxID=2722755 RepID=UPI001430D4A3|nr:hypothetical protein [Thalassospira sp. HF15]NIY77282.1 hypothetical protein [Thalassospira sp. HF15]
MTDSDAPKPAKASGKTSSKPENGKNASEAGAAEAENNLQEPSENPTAGSPEQAAMDMMASLCRNLGMTGFAADSSGTQDQQPQPMETAFQIIQRYLLDGDVNAAVPTPDLASGSYSEGFGGLGESYMPGEHTEHQGTATTSAAHVSDATWGVRTTHADGSTTNMSGPIIRDDMFRTAMPSLEGKAEGGSDTPDWSISMEQGHPQSPTKTTAQTAVVARMQASDAPISLRKWSLHVGISPDGQSELSVTVPNAVPSLLRALLFDTADADGAASQLSEVPVYGGPPHALHLEQTVGTTGSETTPDLALIRLIFADHAPVPIHLEYTGTLPSPIVAGSVAVGPNSNVPFWVQITPPSEGKKGAGLVVLVRYEPETSFDVTAQLMTEARKSTPTAILSCSAQNDHSACRAASMISDSRGRLETSLTGLPDDPDAAQLKKYGFIPPAFMLETDKAPSATAKATAQNNTSGDTNGDANNKPDPKQTETKPISRTTKGKTGNAGSSGGGSKGGSS